MRALLLLATTAAALGFAGAAVAAPSVKIKDAVARVEVIPEARGDVKVEFLTTNQSLPLTIRQNGSDVTIDGGLRMNRINGCNTVMGKTVVHVRGVGDVKWEDIPQVVVRVPMTPRSPPAARCSAMSAAPTTWNCPTPAAAIGRWPTSRASFELNQAGSGDTKAGSAGSAEINIAGSGDVRTQEIGGDLEINIAGSGGVTAASVNGKLEANIAGSGDVTVNGGRSRSVEVSMSWVRATWCSTARPPMSRSRWPVRATCASPRPPVR
jgi:hypothetical protein